MLVNGIWCSHIWAFHTLSKELYWTFPTVLWLVHGLCPWSVCGQFLGSSEARLWPSLWPIFIACVWTVCCADMLDCVLIYVDMCV